MLKTVSLITEPFTRSTAVKEIEKELTFTEGVHAVRVLFNSARVQVMYDEAKTTPGELAATLTHLGYPVLRRA